MTNSTLLETIGTLKKLDDIRNGMEINFGGNERPRLAALLFDLAYEHFRAIVTLIDHSMPSSAAALIRVIHETHLRGLWIAYCATEKQIDAFLKDKLELKMHEMIKEIEKVDEFNIGVFSDIHKTYWGTMNSYTHSGMFQVSRRLTDVDIGPNFTEEEKKDVLEYSLMIAKLSVYEFTKLANDPPRLELIVQLISNHDV
ncbi:hypothetical protein H8L32_16970 [Undibacterium sp. CY18W]|uniref:AbiV family abortive infection protein n=1 Tax=Undibacterium hunanense TaxID=2762292 RepID=A0ABR6ZTL4_9BURK|nr:DUF5677 domain-containing protein [Undibacterium hunanense]MBC3919187.1 hypothetical protein [Undibacterium hunanense]